MPDHGRSSNELPRRDFLKRVSLFGAGGLLLTGCEGGCGNKKEQPRFDIAPGDAETEEIVRPFIPNREPDIRVRIAAVRSPTEPLVIDTDNRYGWITMRQIGTQRIDQILRAPITVQRSGEDWIVAESSGRKPTIDRFCELEFVVDPDSSVPVSGISINGTIYSERVRLVATDSANLDDEKPTSDFDVINHIGVERYLPGVLAKELFQHWHAETFAAQAIAARSFVIAEMQFYASRRHFDVTATQRSQAYIGQTDLKVALDAAEKTRGMVLGWDNTLVPGYYSSCCGGIAANGTDGIGPNPINDIPPLRARQEPDACFDAPVYDWREVRNQSDMLQRVRAYGKSFNETRLVEADAVRAIEVVARNAYGRPTKFEIDTVGNETVSKTLIDARRIRGLIDYQVNGLPSPKSRLKSSFIMVKLLDNDRFEINGRGFGHGVGLCQYGAEALAQQGIKHDRMLPMFYPEVDLVSAYGTSAI